MFVSCQYDVTAVELRQEYAETRKRYKKLIKSSGIFETDCPLVRDREENDQDNRLKFKTSTFTIYKYKHHASIVSL